MELPGKLARQSQAAAAEAQMQAEVAAVLGEMLVDLETWEAENRWRRHRAALDHQQREIDDLRAEVEALNKERETELLDGQVRASEAKALREAFVTELWTLSKSLKNSQGLERRLKKAERDQAQLAKVERELAACQLELRHNQGSAGDGSAAATVAPPAHRQVDPPETMITWVQSALGGKKWKKEAERYGMAFCQAGQTSILAVTRLSPAQLRDLGLTTAHSTLVAVMPPPNSPLSAFTAPFMALEDKALLKVFSFLTADNVLSSAQVCRPFLTRVDALFEMGSHVVTAPRAADVAATPGSTGVGPSARTTRVDSPGDGPGARPIAVNDGTVGPKVGLSAALARQIAAKLNSMEMKGIIQMTERIKKLETLSGHLNEAKEDVESRLQATEAVKEFLVAKLKDTEMALKRTIDGANETARQHQADQEVINFLDSRVQDLERQLKTVLTERDSVRLNLSNTEESSKNQVRTLEDMLHWEQERATKQEAEAKSQKKLLVKEVKALRVQLSQMTTERDAYKQQARTLQLRST